MLPFVLMLLAAAVGWRVWQRGHTPARLLQLGRQSADSEDCEAALRYFDQIPSTAGHEAVLARCSAAEIWLKLGHATKAEIEFREALQIDPRNSPAHDRLANLLTIEGRRFESLPHLYELLRSGHFSLDLLFLAGDHSKTVEGPDDLARFRAAAPEDPVPLIGLARIEMRKQNASQATRLLKQVIATAPALIEAHALLGRILIDSPDEKELIAWSSRLPHDADEHPDIWLVRGEWARRRGESQAAARCLWEALRRDPNHQSATLQLSQLLETLGEASLAEQLGQRAAALAEFSVALELLRLNPDNLKQLVSVARQAESLGRLWEAWGWNQLALAATSEVPWANEALARIRPQLNESLPPVEPLLDPGLQLDLSHYPLLDDRAMVSGPAEGRRLVAAEVRFEDVAQQLGIDFQYFCGQEGTSPRARMFESLGGGIAVVDFDLDGWPDLYFTQGCRWPPRPGQREHLDAIFRNLSAERFVDVTRASGLGDDRFSQGTTVGDFNNDGFPDLYVANIGVNRLYMNLGDGTFSDVCESAGITADRWTTSCVLADFNGDGWPDLYDVNYLEGPGVFEKTCPVDGQPRTCRPSMFRPAADMFYLNLGDGRFREMTEEAGLAVAGGNGLGVVAANFDGSGKLNLFVANDQDANFYFVNRTPMPGARPRFQEHGLLSGLAYDGAGRALACMGAAAGDANGDGRLDMLVTNFSQESSTLYLQDGLQDGGGLFTDATGPSGLREPSYAMLGFGTQFLDGDLDGQMDLVVANGHIHEFSSPGVSYAMRPQYFRNDGGGRFKEVQPDRLGPYFERPCFGRSLVRLDFNRDGREDFAVSSLDVPAAVVCNRTEISGHFLSVRLHGVKAARDAIGAVVKVVAGDRELTQWLCAGDGFQASNQRGLLFGLGDRNRIDKLTVAWPSGSVQTLAELSADSELVLIEGLPYQRLANP